MKSTLVAIFLLFLAQEATAQSTENNGPFRSDMNTTPQPTPDLHLGDWDKGVPAPAPTSGVTLYFDYTKFFEWLLPKKRAKIPPECDPKYFLDSIPSSAPIKSDTTQKPPV